MSKIQDKNYIYIFSACLFSCIFYLVFEYIFTDGQMGVPLDDTWIHFQFADNFAKGYFFQYNPGEYTAGTTSPLYVIVLGSMSYIIKNFIINSVLLSSVFYLLSCIFIYKISLLVLKNDNSLKGLLISSKITPEFISLSLLFLLHSPEELSGLLCQEWKRQCLYFFAFLVFIITLKIFSRENSVYFRHCSFLWLQFHGLKDYYYSDYICLIF